MAKQSTGDPETCAIRRLFGPCSLEGPGRADIHHGREHGSGAG